MIQGQQGHMVPGSPHPGQQMVGPAMPLGPTAPQHGQMGGMQPNMSQQHMGGMPMQQQQQQQIKRESEELISFD